MALSQNERELMGLFSLSAQILREHEKPLRADLKSTCTKADAMRRLFVGSIRQSGGFAAGIKPKPANLNPLAVRAAT